MISALIRGVLLLVLGTAIVGMWGVAVTANIAHAYQLAGSSPWAHMWALASAAGDVFKAAAAFAVFYCARHRKWGPALACCIIWAMTTGWSVKSLIGFSATMVTENQMIKEETLKTSRSTSESIKKEIDGLVEQQSWLRRQMTDKVKGANERERDSVREERAAALQSAKQVDDRIDALRNQLQQHSMMTIQHGVVDPVGKFLVDSTGLKIDMLNNVATVLGFLLLVELCSNLPFLAFGPLFNRPQVALSAPPAPEVMPPAAPAVSAPRSSPKRLGMGLAEIQRRRVSPAGETKRAQAIAYKEDLIALHGAGATVPDVDVIDAWPAWAEREKLAVVMTPWQIGQQLAAAGVRKVEKDGRVHYVLPT